ncbi:MAG: hypothetical protein H7838_05155 [Magnetococcus sp. DMHC-8]
MKAQTRTDTTAGFQVEDPAAVFAAFSQEEIRRRQETEPAFALDIHQEAVQMVLARLRKRPGAVKR